METLNKGCYTHHLQLSLLTRNPEGGSLSQFSLSFFTHRSNHHRPPYVPLHGVGGEVDVVLRSSQQVQSLSQLCLVGDLQQQTHHQLDAANLEHLLKMEYGHREKFLFFSYYTVKFSLTIID